MAVCISQIRIKNPKGGFDDVPCGRCGFCLSNRRKEWSFRLQKEMRQHESASFITLTYSDSNVRFLDDINYDTGECIAYPVLVKKDLQDFIKRVRYYQKQLTDAKIKYYAVGEYGTKTNRPHYHALVFGLHRGVNIDDVWKYGHTDVGECNLDTIDYITKYVVNKKDYKHYLVPPFSCISNGIGLKHLEENYEVYKSKDVVRGDRGYKQKIPRYYKDKIDKEVFGQIEKPQKGSSIIKAKKRYEFDQRHDKEMQRLKKLGHKEPWIYEDERAIANSNRILKASKDNTTL
jgi:hypothetical protein